MRVSGERIKRTRLIQTEKYVVAVEVEMVIPIDDPSEPCYESETVQLLREIEARAERADVAWLMQKGKVYAAVGAAESPTHPLTTRQTYNLIADTIAGPNLRLRDNLFQGLAILLCLVLGAAIGFWLMTDGLMGAFFGGFLGLLVGLFGSGIALMIYRAIKHARGQHD